MINQTIPTQLGTEKIGKLLKQYSIPAIIAMTASSLYNMVDSIFIGQGVGVYAISGLALTFPLMNLAAAFGTLVGAGASTLVSMLLGQKNYQAAKQVLGNVVSLSFFIGAGFTILTLIFLNPILYFFGASEETIGYARDYMTVILAGNIITHTYFGLNSVLRSSGHPNKAMAATILTVLLNTILDPLFIFVFDMGIRGAAIATILAQAVSLAWLLKIFCNRNELLHFDKNIFKIRKHIAKESLSIGMAPFLMNATACFVVIFLNQQLKKYGGDLAIGAYGIVNRISFLFVMIAFGFTQGMQPIVGYNYGAKRYDRMLKALNKTIIYTTAVFTAGFIIGELIPRQIVGIFTADTELMNRAAAGLRIMVFVFPIVGFQMTVSNFFQSIGLARRAILLSLSRNLIFLIPCMFLLPLLCGIDGIWYSFPVSDTLSVILTTLLITKFIKKFKTQTADNHDE